MNRILVIRGGAIGDFILTLPAIRALRETFPHARLEILGYKHIAALAEKRFYADGVQSIEYAALSGFFARGGELDPDLREYFKSFDLIVSYLYDPDQIFEINLQRCGPGRVIRGPAKIGPGSHAARQLARPLEQLGIKVDNLVPEIFPSAEDQQFARDFLRGFDSPFVAFHFGSGSARKNWPLSNWLELGNHLLGEGRSLLVISGEADEPGAATLKHEWQHQSVRFAVNLPLPQLGAILAESLFVGHDSGISHLAAAAGAKCVLLFGPSDPKVWAPPGDNVRVFQAPDADLNQVSVDAVLAAV